MLASMLSRDLTAATLPGQARHGPLRAPFVPGGYCPGARISSSAAHRVSRQLPQLRLRLVRPEAHVHLAVHRRGRRQMLSSLVPLAGLPQELAEVKVAVGDERTHAELACQHQGLAVVAFRRLDSRRIASGDDFTEQAETPRLVAALLVAPGEGHGLLRTFQSIVEAPFEKVCLAEPRELHRPSHAQRTHRRGVPYDLLE